MVVASMNTVGTVSKARRKRESSKERGLNSALLATAKMVPVLLPPLSIRERVDSAMAPQYGEFNNKNKNLSFPPTKYPGIVNGVLVYLCAKTSSLPPAKRRPKYFVYAPSLFSLFIAKYLVYLFA